MKRKITFVPILIILACLFLPVSGFAQDAASSSAGGASTQSFDFTTEGHGEVFIGNYRLGPGDELTIRVFTLDPFEEVIKVSQDGKLILPVIGDLDVAGKTISELRELLTELYSEYYIDFSISIELTDVKQIQIYVFGNARTPGIYIVYANTTLLEFLQKIGLSTSGGNRRMIHHRKDVITEIDPFSMSILGEMEEKNMYLEFGDRIEIPQGQKSVSITGNVFRPGNYEVLEGETLIDILNLAGGPDPFADFNDTVIERPKADGSYERVYIDLEKILNGAEIIELVNRDRLYIPPRESNIYLLGAVVNAGAYPFVESKSVEQYIAEAGGFEQHAHLSFVTVIRPGSRYGNQVAQKFQVNLKEILKEKFDSKKDMSAFNTPHVIIEPGDVIMVPDKGTDDKRSNLSTFLSVLSNVFQSFLIFNK